MIPHITGELNEWRGKMTPRDRWLVCGEARIRIPVSLAAETWLLPLGLGLSQRGQ